MGYGAADKRRGNIKIVVIRESQSFRFPSSLLVSGFPGVVSGYSGGLFFWPQNMASGYSFSPINPPVFHLGVLQPIWQVEQVCGLMAVNPPNSCGIPICYASHISMSPALIIAKYAYQHIRITSRSICLPCYYHMSLQNITRIRDIGQGAGGYHAGSS